MIPLGSRAEDALQSNALPCIKSFAFHMSDIRIQVSDMRCSRLPYTFFAQDKMVSMCFTAACRSIVYNSLEANDGIKGVDSVCLIFIDLF